MSGPAGSAGRSGSGLARCHAPGAALASRARQRPLDSPTSGVAPARSGALGPVERAEESARRAEDAAMRVERAADAAERAAERAEAVTNRMQTAFSETLKK